MRAQPLRAFGPDHQATSTEHLLTGSTLHRYAVLQGGRRTSVGRDYRAARMRLMASEFGRARVVMWCPSSLVLAVAAYQLMRRSPAERSCAELIGANLREELPGEFAGSVGGECGTRVECGRERLVSHYVRQSG